MLDASKGKVFSTTWSPDDALTLAAGGSAGKLQVWDIGANQNVRKTLGIKLSGRALKEKVGGGVISVADGGEGDSDDDE